jgi:hypothetical protein
MADRALTVGTVTLAASIVLSWLWFENHFMVQVDADAIHIETKAALDAAVLELKKSVRISYLELKIDQSNTEMAFIEQGGVDVAETRQYELLKFSVQRMTQQLMEIET